MCDINKPKCGRNQRREFWADMITLGYDEQNSEGIEDLCSSYVEKRRGDGYKMYLEK